MAVRLEDPSRTLLRSALSLEAAGASGTDQARGLARERADDVGGAGKRGRAAVEEARARTAGGLVELPGGEGVGRGGGEDERGGVGRREEEELLQQHHGGGGDGSGRRFGPVP